MQFPTVFLRFLGAGTDSTRQLGNDTVPAGDTAPDYTKDNIFSCRVNNINGWPPQRIVVVARVVGSGSNAVDAIPCTLYFYERSTGAWYKMNGTKVNVTPTEEKNGSGSGVMAYFDIPGLLDLPNTKATLDASGPGNVTVLLIPDKPAGNHPDGEYRFAIAADLTSVP